MRRLSRPPTPPPAEPITPLIDVVFFLLVFFLLVGRMDATAPFAVEPPVTTGKAQDMPGGGITVSVSATGELALDGDTATAADVLEAAAAAPDALIRLNAHAQAPLRAVLPLADDLSAAGAARVVLVVTPEAE